MNKNCRYCFGYTKQNLDMDISVQPVTLSMELKCHLNNHLLIKLMEKLTFLSYNKKLLQETIDMERRKNRLLKFCYMPATSVAHNRLLFFLFCCGHLQY